MPHEDVVELIQDDDEEEEEEEEEGKIHAAEYPADSVSRKRAHKVFGNLAMGRKKPSRAGRKPHPGEIVLQQMIQEAQYEISHDAYRGISSIFQKDSKLSPWRKCAFGSSLTTKSDESTGDESMNIVESVAQSRCPTLASWTNEVKRKGKKRKRAGSAGACILGTRPADPTTRCACDYNPFCLATLGGAMDTMLHERLSQFEGQTYDAVEDGDIAVVDDPMALAYSKATQEQLKNLRQALFVDKNSVVEYVQKMSPPESLDQRLDDLVKWHCSILYVQPLEDSSGTSKSKIRISIPPGISNLGATCYMNTQLQCLVQNRAFVRGILSWSSDKNDRMASIIKQFQQILAQSKAGSRSVITTVEFSNSLGLDHNEQQDPNEFSRLFFDRLIDSFKNSSDVALKDLLPNLFRGVISYETTCLNCNSISRRQEQFMDLNLPIVSSIKGSGKGQKKLEEFLLCDVQLCFNNYCSPERLVGDNQYHCSKCQGKCDAVRGIAFEKLPPVLNVQLSRYVFDRKSFTKKKLSDKVLLPTLLKVPGKKTEHGDSTDRSYVLTAVMRHQGKSAYSGHYVAEAMDWQSGLWFEFNDELVSFLKNGPSCSFDPSNTTGKTPTGSSDAYNMYYVEELFLAKNSDLKLFPDSNAMDVDKERESHYSHVNRYDRYCTCCTVSFVASHITCVPSECVSRTLRIGTH